MVTLLDICLRRIIFCDLFLLLPWKLILETSQLPPPFFDIPLKHTLKRIAEE